MREHLGTVHGEIICDEESCDEGQKYYDFKTAGALRMHRRRWHNRTVCCLVDGQFFLPSYGSSYVDVMTNIEVVIWFLCGTSRRICFVAIVALIQNAVEHF